MTTTPTPDDVRAVVLHSAARYARSMALLHLEAAATPNDPAKVIRRKATAAAAYGDLIRATDLILSLPDYYAGQWEQACLSLGLTTDLEPVKRSERA